jgi:hypothetical protein
MNGRWWMSLMVAAAVAGFGAACGDDDSSGDDEGPEAGSSAGRSGSGTGTSGSGGRGGTSGTGTGTSGTGGSGGASPDNPEACPAAAPTQDGSCTMDGLECNYGTTDCDCEAPDDDPMMLAWDCNTGGGGMMQMCPATEPTNGGTCTGGRGDCEFGARICDCNDDDVWACWDPADCPAAPPMNGSACDPVGMECEYDDGGGQGQGQGQGGGDDCECEDTGWDCGDQDEPDEEDAGV